MARNIVLGPGTERVAVDKRRTPSGPSIARDEDKEE